MQRTQSALGLIVQVIGLLLLLAILAGVLFAVFAVASLTSVPGRVGNQFGDAASGAARVVGDAGQALQRATDPNRPPVGLAYDTEFSALHVWRIGDRLPDGSEYVLSVQSIRRREGGASADATLYALIHAQLRQPRETRLFGQVVRSDADPHDHVLYKGETFRLGRALYRVNWVSQEEAAIAAATLRRPDEMAAELKFEYD
jgi:hypothetical protein